MSSVCSFGKANAAYGIRFQKDLILGLKLSDIESAIIPKSAIATHFRFFIQRKIQQIEITNLTSDTIHTSDRNPRKQKLFWDLRPKSETCW